MIQAIIILALAFVQNVSFSVVSRSRNRDNMTYHLIAAVFSNAIWFMTMRELVLAELVGYLIVPYVIGTVAGSLVGVKVSMWIEKLLNARSDSHLDKPAVVAVKVVEEKPQRRWQYRECTDVYCMATYPHGPH